MSDENTREIVYGRHVVEQLLKSGGTVETLFISADMNKRYAAYFIALGKEVGAACKIIPASKLDALCNGENHQGVAAYTAAIAYVELEKLLGIAQTGGSEPYLLLCDSVQDPHNLGSLLRSALLCGVHGAIITKHSSPGITPVVMKTSAGAAALLPIARVTNLGEAIRTLKKQNIFVYCADMNAPPLHTQNLNGAIAVVVGNEGKGVSPTVKKLCDGMIALPMAAKEGVDSFNVSVAGGIVMHNIYMQRRGKEL